MQSQDALLLEALDRHEPHVRPGSGLADRRRVCCVVLLALLHKGPDRLRRDQLHLVSKPGQHARLMMRRAARLHDDRAGLLLVEKRDQLASS